jgi:hypothetical protein
MKRPLRCGAHCTALAALLCSAALLDGCQGQASSASPAGQAASDRAGLEVVSHKCDLANCGNSDCLWVWVASIKNNSAQPAAIAIEYELLDQDGAMVNASKHKPAVVGPGATVPLTEEGAVEKSRLKDVAGSRFTVRNMGEGPSFTTPIQPAHLKAVEGS